jgi:hypothetical protein
MLNSIPINQDYAIYMSNRNIPLVYTGRHSSIPVLTVENYLKWYDLYVVMPDETVHALGRNNWLTVEYEDAEERFNGDNFGGIHSAHLFNPYFVQFLAEFLGFHLDEQSLEIIIGRWEREYIEQYRLPDPAGYIIQTRGVNEWETLVDSETQKPEVFQERPEAESDMADMPGAKNGEYRVIPIWSKGNGPGTPTI